MHSLVAVKYTFIYTLCLMCTWNGYGIIYMRSVFDWPCLLAGPIPLGGSVCDVNGDLAVPA